MRGLGDSLPLSSIKRNLLFVLTMGTVWNSLMEIVIWDESWRKRSI